MNPNDTAMTVNLGDAYRGAGETDKARELYQRAISLGFKELQTNPRDPAVLGQMALDTPGRKCPRSRKVYPARSITRQGQPRTHLYNDQINALVGKPSQALGLLQEALERHYPAESCGCGSGFGQSPWKRTVRKFDRQIFGKETIGRMRVVACRPPGDWNGKRVRHTARSRAFPGREETSQTAPKRRAPQIAKTGIPPGRPTADPLGPLFCYRPITFQPFRRPYPRKAKPIMPSRSNTTEFGSGVTTDAMSPSVIPVHPASVGSAQPTRAS